MQPGTLFLLVGNSGTGKDTLLSYIQDHWRATTRGLVVPKRYITRPESPETEAFISISPGDFKSMLERDAFSMSWNSYDTWYGVGREVLDEVARGNLVVVNVSRQIIPDTLAKHPSTKVIKVVVPVEVLAARIAQRGRETAVQIASRLDRARSMEAAVDANFIVDNSGTIEQAGNALLEYLETFC